MSACLFTYRPEQLKSMTTEEIEKHLPEWQSHIDHYWDNAVNGVNNNRFEGDRCGGAHESLYNAYRELYLRSKDK